MPNALDIGDVVVLNSGGPSMTVIETDCNRALCAWIDEKGEYDTVWLPEVCVRRLAPRQQG